MEGSSFGGMMSIYHAINYPGTFQGYISHAGALFGKDAYNSCRFVPHLKVADIDEIKKIKDPIFIHHSLDDNRVNVRASLEFYRLAKEANKENLIKLFIDDHGSSSDEAEPDLHGHFYPDGYYLKVFMEQFIDFINSNGENIEPAINNWRFNKFTTIADRFDGLGSYAHATDSRDVDKVLLSHGIDYCKELKIRNQKEFSTLWDTTIAPYLWNISINESFRKKRIINTQYREASQIRLEFKHLFDNQSDQLLKDVVINLVKDNFGGALIDEKLLITDDFINNVYDDVKTWLSYEDEVYKKSTVYYSTSLAFVSFLFNNEFLRNLLLQNKPASFLKICDNSQLKKDLFAGLKRQRFDALKSMYYKIINYSSELKKY